MPIRIQARIREIDRNSILFVDVGQKSKIHKAMMEGLNEGAEELKDVIVNDILGGMIVQKRSGALARAVYIERRPYALIIQFNEDIHQRRDNAQDTEITNRELADILEYGRTGPWPQPRRNRMHPGIKAHYFMREALFVQKEEIKQRVREKIESYLKLR